MFPTFNFTIPYSMSFTYLIHSTVCMYNTESKLMQPKAAARRVKCLSRDALFTSAISHTTYTSMGSHQKYMMNDCSFSVDSVIRITSSRSVLFIVGRMDEQKNDTPIRQSRTSVEVYTLIIELSALFCRKPALKLMWFRTASCQHH